MHWIMVGIAISIGVIPPWRADRNTQKLLGTFDGLRVHLTVDLE